MKSRSYLDGQILIAMPGMSDTRFDRSLIYMCVHSESGAMGIIVNKVAPMISFGDLISQLDILRDADLIVREEIKTAGLYHDIWQAFAVLLPVRTVGVMGDGRTYDQACALRAVTSTDGMTADYYPFPHDFLGRVASRIINEVRGINRVTYDITSKPPGTIGCV